MTKWGKAWVFVAVLIGILAIGAMGKGDLALFGLALLCPLVHLLLHSRQGRPGACSGHDHRNSSHD